MAECLRRRPERDRTDFNARSDALSRGGRDAERLQLAPWGSNLDAYWAATAGVCGQQPLQRKLLRRSPAAAPGEDCGAERRSGNEGTRAEHTPTNGGRLGKQRDGAWLLCRSPSLQPAPPSTSLCALWSRWAGVVDCSANVAGLFLARTSTRIREFAIRTAMGASVGSLVRQLLSETLLLAGVATVIGIALGRHLAMLCSGWFHTAWPRDIRSTPRGEY